MRHIPHPQELGFVGLILDDQAPVFVDRLHLPLWGVYRVREQPFGLATEAVANAGEASDYETRQK